jgi:hypothetical protein
MRQGVQNRVGRRIDGGGDGVSPAHAAALQEKSS